MKLKKKQILIFSSYPLVIKVNPFKLMIKWLLKYLLLPYVEADNGPRRRLVGDFMIFPETCCDVN
jgi:hypothetical protein